MNDRAWYLDSSAIVKLFMREDESEALINYLRGASALLSCDLARVEVVRAVQAQGSEAIRQAHEVLRRIRLLRLSRALLDDAATLSPLRLRTLDAIHVAAARTLRPAVSTLVTYDARMAEAAHISGIAVASPGAKTS